MRLDSWQSSFERAG